MDNPLMPSLEHRALIKTAVELWNTSSLCLDDIEWGNGAWILLDHVIEKVKILQIPEVLKKKISGFIPPIGCQIKKWITTYQNILSNAEEYVWAGSKESLVDVEIVGRSLSKLCWTPQGTVDGKKTAEKLIRDDNLHIVERYKLACIYCLRNDILMLWNEIPIHCRNNFYREDPRDVEQNKLVVFWTYYIKGELTRIRMNDIFNGEMEWNGPGFEWKWLGCTPHECAFVHAVEYYNEAAIVYFWQNLTSQRREELLLRTLGSMFDNDHIDAFEFEDFFNLIIFLLSRSNEKQPSEALKKYYLVVLTCLLNVPWQCYFMEAANLHIWAFLSGDDYFFLLKNIIDENYDDDSYDPYDYKNLFREIWQKIPVTHKEYVRDKCGQTRLLYLLKTENEEYFKIIFASIPDREKLLFSNDGKSFCENLIFHDKMDLLEVFLRECISSKEIKFKFREEFQIFIIHHHSNMEKTREEKTDKLGKFFQLLDELILEDDNRKHVDEGNTNPAAKRLLSHSK